jgi:hypothetical protein
LICSGTIQWEEILADAPNKKKTLKTSSAPFDVPTHPLIFTFYNLHYFVPSPRETQRESWLSPVALGNHRERKFTILWKKISLSPYRLSPDNHCTSIPDCLPLFILEPDQIDPHHQPPLDRARKKKGGRTFFPSDPTPSHPWSPSHPIIENYLLLYIFAWIDRYRSRRYHYPIVRFPIESILTRPPSSRTTRLSYRISIRLISS